MISVADPGFPRRGAQTAKYNTQPIIVANFLKTLH